jgi:hypothetical protein
MAGLGVVTEIYHLLPFRNPASCNKAERIHNCPHCGLVIDRDWNSGINILNRVQGTLGLAFSGRGGLRGYSADEAATLNREVGKPPLQRSERLTAGVVTKKLSLLEFGKQYTLGDD